MTAPAPRRRPTRRQKPPKAASAPAAAAPPAPRPRNRERRFWREQYTVLDEPAPRIPHVKDSTAMFRSLGDPPIRGVTAVPEAYVSLVIEKAAGIAVALAAAAGLLVEEGDHHGP